NIISNLDLAHAIGFNTAHAVWRFPAGRGFMPARTLPQERKRENRFGSNRECSGMVRMKSHDLLA
ncbi:hypothetical protein AD936_07940, partial [Gluconobacter japonicus]